MKKLLTLSPVFLFIILFSCKKQQVEEINIGFIAPLSTRATDLGIAPSKAMKLAIKEYNENKSEEEPTINLFVEDDEWEKDNALPLYNKLRKEHNIDILYISNTDGTIAVQEAIERDQVIAINPLNNDQTLASLNENTFMIAKSTEEANAVLGIRMVELGLQKILILHFPNNFMTLAANSVKSILDEHRVENSVVTAAKGDTNFVELLQQCKEEGYDGYAFLGYKEFGYAMKQARNLGITAQYFGSTTLLTPDFYQNSNGTIVGTECTFFTPPDGNYALGHEFLKSYKHHYGEEPFSVWPPMQAYDAISLVINEVRTINKTKKSDTHLSEWLKNRLRQVKYYQGVCGNISIQQNGASKGIYFSLYTYESKGYLFKVKR